MAYEQTQESIKAKAKAANVRVSLSARTHESDGLIVQFHSIDSSNEFLGAVSNWNHAETWIMGWERYKKSVSDKFGRSSDSQIESIKGLARKEGLFAVHYCIADCSNYRLFETDGQEFFSVDYVFEASTFREAKAYLRGRRVSRLEAQGKLDSAHESVGRLSKELSQEKERSKIGDAYTACHKFRMEIEFLPSRNEELRSGIELVLRGLASFEE